MTKAKATKAVKQAKKTSINKNADMAQRSARISILLFVFVIVLTVGLLMYQHNVKPAGKELLTSTLDAAPVNFSDLSEEDKKNNDFIAALKYLLTKEIIAGYGDNTLKPNNPVNRAEYIKMVATALKADVKNFDKPCAQDIDGTEWFAKYVCYAKDAGWIGGSADGNILPGKQISLAEAIKIMVTAQQWDITNTKDMTLPKSKKILSTAWYVPYIKVAYSKYLLNYFKKDNLDPGMLLKRKDVIMFIFSSLLVDTMKVEKYSSSLIPKLFEQEGIVMSGEAQFKSAPTSPEAPVKTTPKKKK